MSNSPLIIYTQWRCVLTWRSVNLLQDLYAVGKDFWVETSCFWVLSIVHCSSSDIFLSGEESLHTMSLQGNFVILSLTVTLPNQPDYVFWDSTRPSTHWTCALLCSAHFVLSNNTLLRHIVVTVLLWQCLLWFLTDMVVVFLDSIACTFPFIIYVAHWEVILPYCYCFL